MKSFATRAGLLAATAVSAIALASCQAAPPPAPPPVAVIEAPPPTALSANVVQAAAAYQGYVHQATALSATFADGNQIQGELKTGESYEPVQLAHGVVAYAAVLALQDPTFVASVRTYAKDPEGRAQLVRLIYSNPSYAGQIPGAQSAAGLILTRLTADGAALQKTGSAVKQAAYEVQHQPWSKEAVADREGRLALAKQLSASPMAPSTGDSAQILQAAVTGSGLDLVGGSAGPTPNMSPIPTLAPPPYSEGVMRGLAIAALAVLGAAGDNNASQVSALMDEGTGAGCFNLAKLNEYQCLAVARPHYEDVFCLGQHVLMDTGRCVQKVAGTATADVMETKPPALDAATAGQKAAATTAGGRRGRKKH
jgi:hypothetical protein